MNIQQTNKCSMMEAVLSYLTLHAQKISQSSGLNQAIARLTLLMEAIWLKENQRTDVKQGKTDKKKISQSSLADKTTAVAAGLFLWGSRNKNQEIMSLAAMKRSDFTKLRDVEKINRAKAVFSAAAGKDLLFADISADEIAELGQAANDFKSNIGDVSSSEATKIAAGKTLDQMIDEANALLKNEFDKYMSVYETKNREFYEGYKAARVIYDKGGKQTGNNGAEQAAVKTQAV